MFRVSLEDEVVIKSLQLAYQITLDVAGCASRMMLNLDRLSAPGGLNRHADFAVTSRAPTETERQHLVLR